MAYRYKRNYREPSPYRRRITQDSSERGGQTANDFTPDPPGSHRIRPDLHGSHRIRPDLHGSARIHPDPPGFIRIHPDPSVSNPDQPGSIRIPPNRGSKKCLNCEVFIVKSFLPYTHWKMRKVRTKIAQINNYLQNF